LSRFSPEAGVLTVHGIIPVLDIGTLAIARQYLPIVGKYRPPVYSIAMMPHVGLNFTVRVRRGSPDHCC
jgi:hypothetical protein